jgi:alcohol dehydrogenase class IV
VTLAGREAKRLGCRRVFVISGPNVKAAGLVDRVTDSLDQADLSSSCFDGIKPDPNLEVARASLKACKGFSPDCIVGIGGGSSLDIAKVTAMLMTNKGSVDRYIGMDQVPKKCLPLILIPTTAGTGSEVTNIAVLSDTQNKLKKGIVSDRLFADCAILDSALTVGMPPHITAMTGMDALVHAVESYTGQAASVFSDTLNLKAIKLIAGNLRLAYSNGQNTAARKAMLEASALTGMAFSNTQNGLAHALALAIGGRFNLPHGLLTAFILPWVMEYNRMAVPDKFSRIAEAFGEDLKELPLYEASKLSVVAIKSLLDDLDISYRLGDYGVPKEAFGDLAKAAMGASRLINNNPRQVTEKNVVDILEKNY